MSLGLMKLRELYVRLTKQRALFEIRVTLMEEGYYMDSYSYTALRRLYALSKHTILNSQWPGFLLTQANKLGLLEEDELCILRDELDEESIINLLERAQIEMED